MIKINAVGVVVTKTGVTLYLDNGDELPMANDSWRTQQILADVIVPMARDGTVELDLSKYSLAAAVEKLTDGVVKMKETTALSPAATTLDPPTSSRSTARSSRTATP